MKKKSMILLACLGLFLLLEYGSFMIINEQVKLEIRSKVQKSKKQIEQDINELMGYKDAITVGKLGGYAPDEYIIDLSWFKSNGWTVLPDSTRVQARMKKFILSYSDIVDTPYSTNSLGTNSSYEIIKQLDVLYSIWLHSTVWEISHLYKYANTLYLEELRPYAWGYKKVANYEKVYRPTGYEACKNAFEYLTKKDRKYAGCFTEENNKINAILNQKNTYYRFRNIKKATQDDENMERARKNERLYYRCDSKFSYIHNGYYVVFFEKVVPQREYVLEEDTELIEKQIFNKTMMIFAIATASALLLIALLVFIVTAIRKRTK